MPLIHDTDTINAFTIIGAGNNVVTHTMTADGRVGVSLLLSSLHSDSATLTMKLEVLDGSYNSFGTINEVFSKPSGSTRLRIEMEHTIFVPSGYNVRVILGSTGSGNTAITCTWYLFDPNHANDVGSAAIGSIADAVWQEQILDHYEVVGSFAELLVVYILTYAADAMTYSQQVLEDTGTTGVKVASNGMDSVTLPAGIITETSLDNGAIKSTKFGANAINASVLAADVVNDIWMGTALTEAYAADGAAGTPAQLLYMIYSVVSQFDILNDTITCRKLDGTTQAMTFKLNSATNPTLRFRDS
jgi:hypothetical protein